MKVFLDDIRDPKHCLSYMRPRIGILCDLYGSEWEIVRNFDDFVDIVKNNYQHITHVSFDHDLADEHYQDPTMFPSVEDYYKDIGKEKTGLDCARWFKYFYEAKKKRLPVMFVHSMNPVGTQRIIDLWK